MRGTWCIFAAIAALLAHELRAQSPPQPPFPPPGSATTTADTGAPPAEQAPLFITRESSLNIPFTVKPADDANSPPIAVRIFLSMDQGKSWGLYNELKPDAGRFPFRPKVDGEFWFATQTVDHLGRAPKEPPKQPQLRLVLDTQKPRLQVAADAAENGSLAITWTALDPHLNPQSLKIEYQDAAGKTPWEAVSIKPAASSPGHLTGRVAIAPSVPSGAITLRAEVADAAGNRAYYSQQVTLPTRDTRPTGTAAPLATTDPAARTWQSEGEGPSQLAQSRSANQSNNALAPSPVKRPLPELVNNPFTRQDKLASVPNYGSVQGALQPRVAGPVDTLPPPRAEQNLELAPSRTAPAEDVSGPALSPQTPSSQFAPRDTAGDAGAFGQEPVPPPNEHPLPSPEPIVPQRPSGSETGDAGMYGGPDLGGSDVGRPPQFDGPSGYGGPGFGDPGANEPAFNGPPASERVAIERPRLTSSRRFSLEYDVESVGPEGLADVELWGTTDGGQTWLKWGSDTDKVSPFDVEVNGEARFGFRIVIVGRNGLASNAPKPGDAADIWIGVDQTNPTARLTAAAYGSGPQAGKLDIRWEAQDENLGPRPITLSLSDRPDGPFTPIAAGIPNTGQYYWDFDPRSPRLIYLRLEVRDEAGNVAVDQLTEPIQVEGLAPKGRIRGFNPTPEEDRGAFRSPLFR